ncbi:MAG TPA: UPF0182 family protein [Candidatus Dormibacteraeota bacterium]|nr:UPF0182 family protein [Candidatus Dormibacteraeota bacterium]
MARRYSRGPFDPFDQSPFGGFREVQIPRPPRRFWIGLGFIGAALLVVLLTEPLVSLLTNIQWYDALGLKNVFLTRLSLQLLLFFGTLVIAFLFGLANVMVTLRIRTGRALRAVGVRQRMLWTGAGAVGLGATAVISLILAGGVGSHWQELALFMHVTNTGIREPVFGLDVSFYLLTLPFLHDVVTSLLVLFFLMGLVVVGLYAWRSDTFDLRLPPPAIAHVSVLMGGIALLLAASSFLDRYDLLSAHNGYVWGAGYTDVNARIGLAIFRTVLGVLLAILLVANVVPRRPAVLIGAVVVWLVAALISAIYPGLVQRISVQPAELSQESPYISREIQYTRHAFSVDDVQSSAYSGDAPLTAKAVADDQATIQNLRLWDNSQLQDTYQQLQSIRTYYTFNDIELDRYPINGQVAQLEISARELDGSRLPPQAQTWVNQKLQYTHGYSVAASPVSAVVGEGLPDYVARDIPTTGPLAVSQPAIYFGQAENDYALAPSAEKEFDYPQGNDNVRNNYAGTHSPRLNGANRLLWSLRTGDFNMLVSNQLQDQTEILYQRRVQDRIQEIAPFLQLGDNPYIVVANGKLYWIQDAYTGASTYPYSQAQDLADGQNYLRNSVKVVVDAYEGTVDFYIADPSDPIIRAYAATFPGMFKPLDRMPAALQSHLRVPTRLFQVQAMVYSSYHITDPSTFYNREDVWQVALDPYYVQMRLPGQAQAEYLQIIPFRPFNKQNLVSWLAVRNDMPHYGQMVSYVMPKDKVILGPQQISSRIQQTPAISRDRSLLNSNGSSVVPGNLLVVPVGDSFLYVEPWYLKSTTTNQSLPELKKVILTDASTTGIVAYTDTLDAALSALTNQQITTGTATGTPPPTTPPTAPSGASPAVAALVTQAIQHYNAAQNALKQGDLGTYQNEINQVGQLLQQIDTLQGGGAAPSPSPSASPSPRS